MQSIPAKASKKDCPQTVWLVYIVENRLGQLYTGITTDLIRRLRQHRGEIGGGARSLRGKGPLTVKAVFRTPGKSQALILEARIKALSRSQKNRLFDSAKALERLMDAFHHPVPAARLETP